MANGRDDQPVRVCAALSPDAWRHLAPYSPCAPKERKMKCLTKLVSGISRVQYPGSVGLRCWSPWRE